MHCIHLYYSYYYYNVTATTLHRSVHVVHITYLFCSYKVTANTRHIFICNLYYSKQPSVNQLYTTVYTALDFLSCLYLYITCTFLLFSTSGRTQTAFRCLCTCTLHNDKVESNLKLVTWANLVFLKTKAYRKCYKCFLLHTNSFLLSTLIHEIPALPPVHYTAKHVVQSVGCIGLPNTYLYT